MLAYATYSKAVTRYQSDAGLERGPRGPSEDAGGRPSLTRSAHDANTYHNLGASRAPHHASWPSSACPVLRRNSASMKRPMSPFNTACTFPTSTPVRWSFTI